MAKVALITGITGQDGSYLAELLLGKGYDVHGIVRRVAIEDPVHRLWRISHILNHVQLHPASLESFASIFAAMEKAKPDECYHLAAQSYVSLSFEDSFSTFGVNVNGTHHVLEALRRARPECRLYFAGSSEMFGNVDEVPQTERTRFYPRSPYGISKVTGYHMTRNYRDAYGLFACSGILFNHESPRRGFEFVTRKITSGVARIVCRKQEKIRLGNIEAKRDWGFAGDYVKAMWMMLQQPKPDDYVIATGRSHSIKDFLALAFGRVGLSWQEHTEIDPALFRPAEVDLLVGDASKAHRVLGWKPEVGFEQLVEMMVDADLERERKAL